jgi:hypothetical protein
MARVRRSTACSNSTTSTGAPQSVNTTYEYIHTSSSHAGHSCRSSSSNSCSSSSSPAGGLSVFAGGTVWPPCLPCLSAATSAPWIVTLPVRCGGVGSGDAGGGGRCSSGS